MMAKLRYFRTKDDWLKLNVSIPAGVAANIIVFSCILYVKLLFLYAVIDPVWWSKINSIAVFNQSINKIFIGENE